MVSLRDRVIDALMWSTLVVVAFDCLQYPMQAALSEDNEVVERFAGLSNESFSECVGVGRLGRGQMASLSLQDAVQFV